MRLAEAGLPKGGGVGYEIFDKSDVLGATSFVQNINRLRALEGELARTIRAHRRVQDARVHLVLPERPLFSREKVEPSASIVLKVRGTLEAQQVRAIRHLIATAVNGLRPERVSIVDESGQLLADGSRGRHRRLGADGAERQPAFERRLREQVESIVRRWSARAGPACSSPPISTSTASPRHPTRSIRKAAWCARARRGRTIRPAAARKARSPSATSCPAAQRGGERPAAPRSEQEDRGDRQLRDLAHDQDRGRSRAGASSAISAAVAGRRHLRRRTKRANWSISRARKRRSTASPRWCARRSASTRSAATRSRSSICASPRRRRLSLERADRLALDLRFTKADIMRGVELGVSWRSLCMLVVLFVVRPLVRRVVAPERTRTSFAP